MKSGLIRYTLFWAGAAVALAGCGDDGLDPDVTGLVDVVVHDNVTTAAFTGTAAGNIHAAIRSTGGEWVEVGMPNGITVALESTAPTSTPVHGPQSVPAGTYDMVRLTFSAVTFTVSDGGGGTIVTNAGSAVLAGTAALELEVAVAEFTVSSTAGTASVSFDLNVEAWLTDAMLTAGVIADGDLTGRLTATATGG